MKEQNLFNQDNTLVEEPGEELKKENKKEEKEKENNNELENKELESETSEKEENLETMKKQVIDGIKKNINEIDVISAEVDSFAQEYETKININIKTPDQKKAKEELIGLLDRLELHLDSLNDMKDEFNKLLDTNKISGLKSEDIDPLIDLYKSKSKKDKEIHNTINNIKEKYKDLKVVSQKETEEEIDEKEKPRKKNKKVNNKSKNETSEKKEKQEKGNKDILAIKENLELMREKLSKISDNKDKYEKYLNDFDIKNEAQKKIKKEIIDTLIPKLDKTIVSFDKLISEFGSFKDQLNESVDLEISNDQSKKLDNLYSKVNKLIEKEQDITMDILLRFDELKQKENKEDKEKELDPKKETEKIDKEKLNKDIDFQLNMVANKLLDSKVINIDSELVKEYEYYLEAKNNDTDKGLMLAEIKGLRDKITKIELENVDLSDYHNLEKKKTWKDKKGMKIAKGVYEAASSVAGINIFHTLPQYLKQKKSIKDTDNTIEDILKQSNNILEINREGEYLHVADIMNFDDSWARLHRMLNNMEGGEKKHSNVRKKMASILKEFRLQKDLSEEELAETEERFNKELNSLMENFVSTKTSSMKVKKEAVNTAVRASQFFIPAAGMARVALYSGLELTDRKKKMTREKIQEQDLKGEKIEKEDSKETKTGWLEALNAGIKETYQGATFAGEKGAKGKKTRAFKSYMHILRYVGIGAMGISALDFNSEGAEELANKAIEKVEGSGVAENFISRYIDAQNSSENTSFMESIHNIFAKKPELNLDADNLAKYGLSPDDVNEKSELLNLDLDSDKLITANDIRLIQEQELNIPIDTKLPLTVAELESVKALDLAEGQAITDEIVTLSQNNNFSPEQMNMIVSNSDLLSNTEVLENMHPSILNQVLENGALEERDIVLNELIKENNLNDDELSTLIDSNLGNKADMLDKINELRTPEITIEKGDNFTSALTTLLNESNEKIQDAFIGRVNEQYGILKEGEELSSANREELLNKAINRLSVEGANPDSGVANYVYEGNILKIDAETGQWELEQGEAEYEPQAKEMSSGPETTEEDFNFMEKVKDRMGINYGDKVIPRTFIEEQGFEDTNLSPNEAAQVNEDFDKLSEVEKDQFIKDNIRRYGSEEAIEELSRLEGEEIAQSGTEVESDIETRTGSGDDSFSHESNDVEEDLVREEVVTDTEELDNTQEDLNNTETEPEIDSSREQSSAGEGTGVENETAGEKEIPDIFMKDYRGLNERAGISEGFGSDLGQNIVEEKWENLSEATKEWYYNYSDNMKSLEVGDASEKVNALRNLFDIKDTHSLNMEDGKFVLDNDTKFEILEGSFKYTGHLKEITPENISDIRSQLGLDR
jgi:hypothetical protein